MSQVAPKASGANKWQNSPIDTSTGQLVSARANGSSEQPVAAAFYSIKDGKTSARRIQQASLPARQAPTSTPSPVFDLSTIDSQNNQGAFESTTQPASQQAESLSASELATGKEADNADAIQQQHLTSSSISEPEPSTGAPVQNQTGETDELGSKPQVLTTATGSPLTSSTPSSLSMSLDGMMMNTRPRAAASSPAPPMSRASDLGRTTSGAPSTTKPKQPKTSKSARIGESAKSRRVPFTGVPFSSPATKGQRIRPATSGMNQFNPASSQDELANQQVAVSSERPVSGALVPMDARSMEIMNNLLNKPSWRDFESQQVNTPTTSANPNEDLVMSVMSSADGKERRLVMISRDSLNSLQQLAKQQQQQQQQHQQQQQQQGAGQTNTVKSTAVGQQQQQFAANGVSSRWQASQQQQQQVSSQVAQEVQTTTLAPGFSSPSSSSLLTSLSSVFTDEPASSQPTTAGQQSSSQASLDQQTPTSTSTVSATTTTTNLGADLSSSSAVDSQLSQGRSPPSPLPSQSSEPKSGSTFREVPVSQSDNSSPASVPKRTPSNKASKSGKGKAGSAGSKKGKGKANRQSATSGHSNSTLTSAKPSSSRRNSSSKLASKEPQVASGSGAGQQRAKLNGKADQVATSPMIASNNVGSLQATAGALPATVEQAKPPMSELERLDGLRAAIPGEPQLDYPIYSVPPKTSFDCMAQSCPGGYYADLDSQCQVFHICQNDGRFDTFLCPNGTIFSQQHFVCVWWWQVDCQQSPSFYKLNDAIYCNSNVPMVSSAGFRQFQQQQPPASMQQQQQQQQQAQAEQTTTSSLPARTVANNEFTTVSTSGEGAAPSRDQQVLGGAAASLTGAGTGLPMRLQEPAGTESSLADFDSTNQQQLELSRKA